MSSKVVPENQLTGLRAASAARTNSRKGKPNKSTASIKAMIEESLQLAGGAEYFRRQSIENPGAYMQLVGKILPKNMTLDVDVASNISKKITFEVIHSDPTKLIIND